MHHTVPGLKCVFTHPAQGRKAGGQEKLGPGEVYTALPFSFSTVRAVPRPKMPVKMTHRASVSSYNVNIKTDNGIGMKAVDLTGQKFNRLLVISRAAAVSPAGAIWRCVCDCGTEVAVNSLKLRAGKTKSCGCLRDGNTAQLNKTHGMANKSPAYKSWKEMRFRCNSPKSDKWEWYGGRGISVCKEWDSFEVFLKDMGQRPPNTTIDRIDNDGNYEPSNCRWASQLDQTRKQEKNKLRDGISELLRADRLLGMSYRALGDKYKVSATTAHRCCIGRTWA